MIILNYCNLIATSRHRAETSSRGRGRAGAEAGSGVAAGRQAVLHQAFCGHNVCPRRGSLSSPGVGSGSGPQEPRSSGSLLAHGVLGDVGVLPGRCAGCQAWHGPRGPEGEVRVGSSAAWGLIRSRLTSNGAAAAAAFGSVPLTHTTATSLPCRPPSCFHGGSRSPAALAEGS